MAILLFARGVAVPVGQDTKGKDAPSDEQIIDMVGGRLAKIFVRFGTPADLFPVRANESPEMDLVILEYRSFAFGIRNKTVQTCYFVRGWAGTIKGIKLGDSREQVVKTLGKEYEPSDVVNNDNVYDFAWDLKETDSLLWAIFDKQDK